MTEDSSHKAVKTLYPQVYESLSRYVDILGSRGIEYGLLGPRESDKLWSRHIANSMALLDPLPHGVDVADVGSGAGLPGIPVAIAREDLRLTLIESLQRRADFLRYVVDELGLGERVEVVRARAEEISTPFDVVTCRAVAPLDRLLKWTTPLFHPDGQLLALKGSAAEDEIREARKRLERSKLRAEVLELTAGAGLEPTRAIRVTAAL